MAVKRRLLGVLVLLLVLGANSAFAAAPDVPGWEQVNTSGFGDPQAVEVTALAVFNGYLYAGIANPTAGARIFRSSDGTSWTPVSQAGFGIGTDTRPLAIMDLTVFKGGLYASTGRNENAGQIWRSWDGTTWTPMVIAGFSNPDTVDITVLAEFNGDLYAGATNRVTGAQVWRSGSGDNNTWTRVAPAVPGTDAATITGMAVYGGALYAAVESNGPAQIWRTEGGDWTTVMSDGFGNNRATLTGGMVEFAGYLYVGAGNPSEGALLWRTVNGANWTEVIPAGFGDPNNETVESVFVFQNQLYVTVKNNLAGMKIWRSNDGTHWEPANQGGFGDSNNSSSNRSNAGAVFLSRVYIGTANGVDGGEVWRMLQQQPSQRMFLPLILR